jgi:predicted small lipoprotein YifL
VSGLCAVANRIKSGRHQIVAGVGCCPAIQNPAGADNYNSRLLTYNLPNKIIAGINMRSGIIMILILAFLLPGCGRKGPLRLPEKQAQTGIQAPVEPVAEPPKPDTSPIK